MVREQEPSIEEPRAMVPGSGIRGSILANFDWEDACMKESKKGGFQCLCDSKLFNFISIHNQINSKAYDCPLAPQQPNCRNTNKAAALAIWCIF